MSNHYHLVLRVDQLRAKSWTANEVVDQWTKLHSMPTLVAGTSDASRQVVEGHGFGQASPGLAPVATGAEATDDGAIHGSVVGTIDGHGGVERLRTIDRRWKVEGVYASMDARVIDFLFVETETPLIFGLLVAGLLGFAIGWLLPIVRRGRDRDRWCAVRPPPEPRAWRTLTVADCEQPRTGLCSDRRRSSVAHSARVAAARCDLGRCVRPRRRVRSDAGV